MLLTAIIVGLSVQTYACIAYATSRRLDPEEWNGIQSPPVWLVSIMWPTWLPFKIWWKMTKFIVEKPVELLSSRREAKRLPKAIVRSTDDR